MQLLGSGSFTVAYRLANGKVRIISQDPIKEEMAKGCFPNHPMFPTIQRHFTNRATCKKRYTMPYYNVPKDLNDLLENLDDHQSEFYKYLRDNFWCIIGFNNILRRINNMPEQFKIEQQLLLKAVRNLKHYKNDLNFETAIPNLAYEDGKLILLDCFFLRSLLNKVRGW